ncbi:MAG: hypothetical protein GXX83_02945 [Gaiellales bacterium]|nr:hypothetical protein [Gaiellales bacterium]
MTPVELDLHTHTPHVSADYRGPVDTTPRSIVEAAIAAGLGVIAVTDHFSVGYVHQMVEAARVHAQESGAELVVLPGVELRVSWRDDEVHLVAIFPPESYQACFEELAHTFGIDERMLEMADLPTVRLHAHPCMVAERVVKMGGICHIAHVDRWFGTYRLLDAQLFDELVGCPAIAALDVIDPANVAEVERRAPGVAVISSSDAHSPDEIGRRRATLWLEEPSFAALARALGAGARGEASQMDAPPIAGWQREHARRE